MESDTNNIIEAQFKKMPLPIQRAITSAEVEQKLRALAKEHKLHLDQWVQLENEIMLTLLGLSDPEEMVNNVVREVGVSKDVAQELVNDIVEKIFEPIRLQLQTDIDDSLRSASDIPAKQTIVHQQLPEPAKEIDYVLPDTLSAVTTKKESSGGLSIAGSSAEPKKSAPLPGPSDSHDPYREVIE